MYAELTRRRVARDPPAMTTKDLDAFFEAG
jgi:hypothetical protein